MSFIHIGKPMKTLLILKMLLRLEIMFYLMRRNICSSTWVNQSYKESAPLCQNY